MVNRKHYRKIYDSITGYEAQIEMQKPEVYQDYFLSYYCTFINILACLAEDLNGATESKCQSYYPL